MHLRTHLFTGARLVWEGPAIILANRDVRVGAGATRYELLVDAVGLAQSRDATANMVLGSLAPKHELALEWLAEARASEALPIRLVNLWFAIVVTVDSGYSATDFGHVQGLERTQMERVEDYLTLLSISEESRATMLATFRKAYSLRNRIVHRGERECVANDDMVEFNDAVIAFLQTDLHRS